MSFVEAIQSCFSQYVGFSGRARRSEYWFFVLFETLVGVVCSMLLAITGSGIFMALSYVASIACFLPALSVGIRRLHDIGKSGWWWFIALVPLVGSILLLVWMCKDSEAGDNEYGANPKAY